MPRKKKRSITELHRSSRNNSIIQGFYNPFEGLDQHLRGRSLEPSSKKNTPLKIPMQPAPQEGKNEDDLFKEAMVDVTPLAGNGPGRVPPSPPTKGAPRFWIQEEEEAYLHLTNLVAGEGTFELTYSDEYVDGAVSGISPKILKKLRNGDFSYQDYVDLHGYNLDQAYDVVVDFIQQSFARGYRCVLIIPGRGLRSKERQPVIKKNLVTWLTRAPLKRLILAFASARSYDGGLGALYILMRRRPGKGAFVTPIR